MEYQEISKEEVKQALDFSAAQILKYLPEFTDKFQNAYSVDNFYEPVENNDWTDGFWTGEIWLAYEHTGNEAFREAAEVQVKDFLHRIDNKICVDHHDMGFLYTPSCVAAWKLTGNELGKEAAVKAADQLISRFHEKGEFIQAWGAMNAPENYRLIIDCLLNLPLLYWASEETGDSKYRDIAEKHIHTALANVIREDGSTWHTFFFNMETGEPDHGATCQGYRDGSAWARGQAWGVYGTALGYRYTKEKNILMPSAPRRSTSCHICRRIWCLTGILNLQMAPISPEIPRQLLLQPAVCWKWLNTCLRRMPLFTAGRHLRL